MYRLLKPVHISKTEIDVRTILKQKQFAKKAML